MGIQLRDLLNIKTNKNNKQVSLDVKKKELKRLDLDMDDILDIQIIKKEKLFK